MGVFMAEVYMCIYNWQEKKEENQASEYFCHAPNQPDVPRILRNEMAKNVLGGDGEK